METENEEFRWLEIDLSDVSFLIRKHIVILLLAPLITASLGIAIAKQLTPMFATKAVFFVRPNFDQDLRVEQTSAKLDDGDSLRSIAGAMVSDTVILKMIDNLNLREAPDYLPPGEEEPLTDIQLLKKVRDRYKTKLKPTTRLVQLTVEDYSRERTVMISRELANAFLVHMSEERLAHEKKIRATLESQADKILKNALASEERLSEFRTRHPETLVEQDSSMFHERVLQQSAALNDVRSEKSRLAGLLSALDEIDPTLTPHQVFQVLNQKDNQYLADLLTMESTAKANLAVASETFTERHPQFKAATTRVRDIDQSVKDYAIELKGGVKSEFLATTQRMESLEKNLSDLQTKFIQFKSTSAEFRGLKDEIDRNWNTHSKLQQRIMNLDLDPEILPSFMTPISSPLLPYKKVKPRTLFWAAGGMALGGLIAALIVWWKNRHGLPFTSKEQSSESLGIQQVADLQFPNLKDPEKVQAALEESFNLRDVMIAARNAKTVHLTTLSEMAEAHPFPAAFGKGSAKGGLETLLITLGKGKSPGIINESSGNFSAMNLRTSTLLDFDTFETGIKTLLDSFDRVVINTSQIPEQEAKLAISQLSDVTILTIDGEGPLPRSAYQRFARSMKTRGIDSTVSVYLKFAPFKPKRERKRRKKVAKQVHVQGLWPEVLK